MYTKKDNIDRLHYGELFGNENIQECGGIDRERQRAMQRR